MSQKENHMVGKHEEEFIVLDLLGVLVGSYILRSIQSLSHVAGNK